MEIKSKKTKQVVSKIKAPNNWADLRVALAIFRAGGIKKAAKTLMTTEGTISRHIGTLEENLGIVLFERTQTGMIPTPACSILMEHVSNAEAEFECGIETAVETHKKPAGSVRITTVPILMNHILIPEAYEFLKNYPDLNLEFLSDHADLSMMQREADIAIRLTRPSSELNVITTKIGDLEYGVFASEDSLRSRSANSLPWLTYESSMSHLPQARWVLEVVKNSGESISNITCNDAECLVSAISHGVGKALLPRIIAQRIPVLTEVNSKQIPPVRELWILLHPNLQMTGRVRVIVQWLRKLFLDSESNFKQ